MTYTPFKTTLSLRSPCTSAIFLMKKQSYGYMHKRTMFSRLGKIIQNSATKVDITNMSKFNTKSYATWIGAHSPKPSKKDPKCDPKALSNNDKNHTEIVKGECSKDGCGDKICHASCAEDHEKITVGHFTHGKHETEGKKNVKINPDEDYNGSKKPQNAIIYSETHKTHPDSVKNEQATEFLHKDDSAAIKIVDDAIAKLQKKK